MLAFRVSNLGVGGSRCYDRVNARVERNDEGYAGAEEVLCIRRSEDVVAECRITVGVVHGSGVLVERGVLFGDAEVVGRPVDFGMVGFGKLSLIFSGSSDADAMMWAEVVRRLSC